MEPTMNGTSTRQQRGLELAATRTIRQKGGIWIVPSQAGTGAYRVHIMPKIASCTCPDFETRGVTCKHIFAVTYVMKREQHADGSETVTKTLTVTATTERTTYPQNWPACNQAQVNEKDRFQVLLICVVASQSHKCRRWDGQACHCATRFSA